MTVRNLFLVDAVGALMSVVLMSLILPSIQEWIGMPLLVLYGCAVWAIGCMVYSFACYWYADLEDSKWLFGIMLGNTLYCVFTALLIAVYFHTLTYLGVVYFIGEIPVILGLVLWERKTYQNAYKA